jgi:hypothetical protein
MQTNGTYGIKFDFYYYLFTSIYCMTESLEQLVEWNLTGETEVLKKHISVSLSPP